MPCSSILPSGSIFKMGLTGQYKISEPVRGICELAVQNFGLSNQYKFLNAVQNLVMNWYQVLFCKEKIEPLDCVMATIKRSGLRDFNARPICVST